MTGADPITARSIAEHLLDETGRALQDGDLKRFGSMILLPHIVASFSGRRRLTSMDDVEDVFNAVRRYYIADGITRVERYVDECDYVNDAEIHSTHVSQLYRGAVRYRAAYPTLSTIKRAGKVWKIASSQYAVSDSQAHEMAFSERDDAIGSMRDRAIFQSVLDEVTLAYVSGNFDLFYHRAQLPVFVQSRSGSQLLSSEEELKADFELYQAEFQVRNITDIVRTLRSVMPVGEGKLVGTYLNHILSGHTLVMPSYASSMHMDRGVDGIWRVSAVLQAMGHSQIRNHIPGAGHGHAPFEIIMTAPSDARGH